MNIDKKTFEKNPKATSEEAEQPFHRFLDLSRLSSKTQEEFSYDAQEKDLQLLAQWAKVEKMTLFSFEITPRVKKEMTDIELDFTLKSEYQQLCVNSGEPIDQKCDIFFTVVFLSPTLYTRQEEAYYKALNSGEVEDLDFEPITKNKIDVGDIAIQYFLLEVDPYPKKVFLDLGEFDGTKELEKYDQEILANQETSMFKTDIQSADDMKVNPFKVLEKLKNDK